MSPCRSGKRSSFVCAVAFAANEVQTIRTRTRFRSRIMMHSSGTIPTSRRARPQARMARETDMILRWRRTLVTTLVDPGKSIAPGFPEGPRTIG